MVLNSQPRTSILTTVAEPAPANEGGAADESVVLDVKPAAAAAAAQPPLADGDAPPPGKQPKGSRKVAKA